MALARFEPAAIQQELEAAAVAFGRNLRRWRLRNGWSQNTAQDWGQAIGIAHVFNSQWSQLETARLRGPKPLVFRALGIMNGLLAAGEYGPILDRALLDRVKQAEPICQPDGRPWQGSDFYASFMGQLPWPEMAERLPEISDREAAEISNEFRQAVRAAGGPDGARIGEVLAAVIALAPRPAQARVGEVLMGDNWRGSELMQLRTPEGELMPQTWLDRLTHSAKR